MRNLVAESDFKETDSLFASIDTDGGGTLDAAELKPALTKLIKSAGVAAQEMLKVRCCACHCSRRHTYFYDARAR